MGGRDILLVRLIYSGSNPNVLISYHAEYFINQKTIHNEDA